MIRTAAPWLLLAACNPVYLAPETAPEDADGPPEDYLSAARAAEVPYEVLMAISRAETGFQMVQGGEEFPGQAPAYGVMGLRGANLEEGALLAGLDVEAVKTDRAANVAAAAWLLATWALEEGIDTTDLSAWAPIVARYSGITDEQGVAEYVHREVYAALRQGIELEGFAMRSIDVAPDWPAPLVDTQRARDSSAVWSASPNYSSRSGLPVELVVIHTCEGTYSGCWSWLANGASGVSAHYVVNDAGTEVRALVDESNKAWHVGANYDCDLNGRTECGYDGTGTNSISVGIEHAGYASQSTWSNGLLDRSAELTCGITQRHGIVRDSYHIVGHGKLQPYNRTDPGANWPWADYIDRVKDACGDGGSSGGSSGGSGGSGSVPAGSTITIDSNNAANVTSKYYIDVSANWWSSVNVGGYWNTGYWVAPTAAVSDPASFYFSTASEQCYKVEAWWTASSDRPSSIAFVGWDDEDHEVGRATVNQTVNGGRWNLLGHWRFPAGWNRVLLSRWTTAGKYAIADAVRLTPSSSCP
jgi:hypothetical protein